MVTTASTGPCPFLVPPKESVDTPASKICISSLSSTSALANLAPSMCTDMLFFFASRHKSAMRSKPFLRPVSDISAIDSILGVGEKGAFVCRRSIVLFKLSTCSNPLFVCSAIRGSPQIRSMAPHSSTRIWESSASSTHSPGPCTRELIAATLAAVPVGTHTA